MKSTFLSLIFTLLLSHTFAQHAGTISGKLTENGKPLQGATVSLLRAADSATVKLSASTKEGLYAFDKIANGKYLLSITAVGRQKVFSQPFAITPEDQAFQVPEIVVIPLPKDLAGVTVSSKRPLIEQRIDRTVVNVDASITNVGTSALEVLEKAPGVSVDREGNISLKGKDGVLIMVDGRPTQLSGPDLANLLRNMNSSQMDQVEIMTNPPARYDASGTSGIINIKTKKTQTVGYNGSASVTYTQGKYPKTNEGFNFNYRNAKLNVFSNLAHNYQQRASTINIDRNILNTNTNSIDNIFSQEGNRMATGNAYNVKAGVDFFATKKTTFGAVFNLNARKILSDNPSITNIFDASKSLESVTAAIVSTENKWKSGTANLNFRTLLDTKGKELTSDIDVVKHRTDNDLFMINSYTDASGNEAGKSDTLTGLLPQRIDVYSARADYLHPIKKDARFEAGIKSSIVRTDNVAGYDSIQNGVIVHDFNRSNHFVYEENINAAYVNLSMPLSKKINAQLGLRVENTNATGRQKTTGETFDMHYTQLFPTAYLQYKLDDDNNFGINLGRRVTRPNYQSLNPFIRFIDRYTYSQGNPNLRPSISNSLELSHTWKNKITTVINYTNVKNIVQEVIQQKGQEAYNMPANVSTLNQVGIAVNANTSITRWWTSNVNLNVYHDSYKGTVGVVLIDLSTTSFVFNTTQQFKISKTLSAEINGRYRNGWLEGVLRIRPVGFVGAGVSQQIMKNKATIRLAARDIFFTQKMKGKSQYGNVDFVLRQVGETQTLSLSFTYSFSKGKKIAPVKRTAGSSNEEQNRIGQ